MQIKPVTLIDLAPYRKAAEREGLLFCQNAQLYGLYQEEELLGFIGLLRYANKNIVKNIWVPPAHRGKGYFKHMLEYCMGIEPEKRKEASCTRMSVRHFLARGFKIMRVYKNGITKVYYEDL